MYQQFIEACLEANKTLKNYIKNDLCPDDLQSYGTLGFGGDRSLNIDIKAEKIFIEYLLPFCDIYSEEIGFLPSNSPSKIPNAKAIIDPLDGSDNFFSRLPYYATSIALKIGDKTLIGLIYNLIDGTYILKDHLGNCNREKGFQKTAKIALFERAYKYPDICKKLYDKGIKYRSPGAVALSLAHAENFQFLLFGGRLRAFDLEAGLYINSTLHFYQNKEFLLLAKNIEIFNEIKEIIKQE